MSPDQYRKTTTMKTTHTPGPWEMDTRHIHTTTEIWDASATGKPVAIVVQKPAEEMYANARLIASAPDLLACLVAATLEIESLRKASKEAIAGPSEIVALSRAAIAKATQT